MNNLSFSSSLLGLGILQIVIALFWVITGYKRPLARWFGALILLFGVANIVEGVATPTFLTSLPLLAKIHALVTPVMYLTFLGGIMVLIRPQWGEGKVGRALFGMIVFVAALVAADVFMRLGLYFMEPVARETSLPLTFASYTATSPLGPTLALLLPSLGALALVLLTFGLVRRMNPEQRALQAIVIFTIILTALLSFSLSELVQPMSAANFILTIGLFVVMAISTPNLLDWLGGIVANQPIPTKLSWGFGSLLFITLVVGGISVLALLSLNQLVQDTLSTQNRLAISANSLLDQYRQARRHERDFELQARTTGLDRALQGPYAQWLDSVKAMERTLQQLKRENLTPDQRNRVKTIESMYQTYLHDSENLFQGYRRRGDREVGSLAGWLTATEVLDQQISSVSNNQPFNELFLSLRTQQAYYLISENSNRGNEIQDLYDEMQEFLLFSPEWDVPLGDRVTTQELLQEEAVAFSQVRESTRGLTILRFTLEGTSTVLEQYISEFSTQANTAFNLGVGEIEASREFYSIVILVVLAISLVIAYLLSEIVTRQIRGPVLALVDAADQMASGKLNVRAEVLSRDELGVAANALNTMASRLQSLLGTLEERVAHRTAQLETAAQVAAAASEVRDLNELLVSTTNLLIEHFEDVYHAQVFLVDQQGEGEWAVLRASTGEVGEIMLAREHRLQVGSTSVIGKVTA
nr:HAMP domain-containing protein [Ardenticatenales bacterium]